MLCQQIYFMTNENICRAHLLGRFKMISIISKMIITIESGVVLFVEDIKKYKVCKLLHCMFNKSVICIYKEIKIGDLNLFRFNL